MSRHRFAFAEQRASDSTTKNRGPLVREFEQIVLRHNLRRLLPAWQRTSAHAAIEAQKKITIDEVLRVLRRDGVVLRQGVEEAIAVLFDQLMSEAH